MDEITPDDGENRRYPHFHRLKYPDWYIVSSAQEDKNVIKVTVSDEATTREAISATLEKQSLWQSALDTEFESLDSKNTWARGENPRIQPLPTQPALNSKAMPTAVLSDSKLVLLLVVTSRSMVKTR